MILKQFNNTLGTAGDILLFGALSMVETNLTTEKAKEIRNKLAKAGFPRTTADARVKLVPKYETVRDFNFADDSSLDSLHQAIIKRAPHDSTFTREKTSKEISDRMYRKLMELISKAAKIEDSNPKAMAKMLGASFEQKAWMQIEQGKNRDTVIKEIRRLLKKSYINMGEYSLAAQLDKEIAAEANAIRLRQAKKVNVWLPFIGFYQIIIHS